MKKEMLRVNIMRRATKKEKLERKKKVFFNDFLFFFSFFIITIFSSENMRETDYDKYSKIKKKLNFLVPKERINAANKTKITKRDAPELSPPQTRIKKPKVAEPGNLKRKNK